MARAENAARIAIDLGAESWRVSLLRVREGRPQIRIVARIPNAPYMDAAGNLRWPLRALLAQTMDALRMAASETPEGIGSIGVDGWAVDYVRLPQAGEAVEDPFCYRDERTVAAKNALDAKLAPEAIFAATGVQPMRINTIYQLVADRMECLPQRRWLLLPEYVLHTLGAEPVAEFTNATHTGLVDAKTREWSSELFARAGLEMDCAPRIVPPGTRIGRVSGELAEMAAFRETELIAPACHDTASAVAAMAGSDQTTAYLICGTWSLMGAVMQTPRISSEALRRGFTNLGAASGDSCFHTNINGMWMLKQCVETWLAEGRTAERVEFGSLALAAEAVDLPAEAIFPVDAPELLLPGEMPEKIRRLTLAHSGYRLAASAEDEAEMTQLILNSLAHRYARALEDLEALTERSYGRICVLGGGARNALLLRLIAKSTGRAVTAGPVEASTLGNFALQMTAGTEHGARRDALRRAIEWCVGAEWQQR